MKHEKYITEKKTKTGHYLNVSIFYAGEGKKRNHFSKNVNVAEYPSAADAMAAAVMIRDQALKDIQKGPAIKHTPTVDELYKQTAKLFNSSLKTKRRHDESYEHCIKKYGSIPITDIKREFTLAIKASGVKPIRLHDLRHSHVSNLIAAGVPVPAVAQRIGDTIQQVEKTYAHMMPDSEQFMNDQIAKLHKKQ